jgi:hypothetical protein
VVYSDAHQRRAALVVDDETAGGVETTAFDNLTKPGDVKSLRAVCSPVSWGFEGKFDFAPTTALVG